jgi:hypothetical protein
MIEKIEVSRLRDSECAEVTRSHLARRRYDLIILSHVLEHTMAPATLLSGFQLMVTNFRPNTPPVNAVTDASIVAAGASGTLLVVEQGRTTFPALGHAKQMLTASVRTPLVR